MEFYIYRDGHQLGPYSQAAIQDLLRLGSVSSADLAWCEGLTDWIPLGTLLTDMPAGNAATPQPVRISEAQTAALAAPRRSVPVRQSVQESSFGGHLLRAFSYPLRRDGFIFVIGGGVFWALPTLLPSLFLASILVMIFVAGYLFAYLQKIIQSSAAGAEAMPTWPDFSNFTDDIIVPYFQFFAIVMLCLTGPLWFWHATATSRPALTVVGIGWLALGVLCFPMALLAVTMYDTLAALNPLLILRSILLVPGSYLLTVIVVYGLVVVEYLVDGLLARVSIPILSPILSGCLSLYFLAVVMRVLGVLYLVNRHRLGWFKTR